MKPVDVIRGEGAVVLGVPHAGTHVPGDIWERLNPQGRLLADTDWHVDRLYADLLPGATMVRANFHRYVVDANRDPDGASLYPGRNTTDLCPTTDFDGRAIYLAGQEPGAAEIRARRAAWHAPYHAALSAEVHRVRAQHGAAILYDCHSIRSEIPFLFSGILADFNIGDNDGATCAPSIRAALETAAANAHGYASVVNGRFKGGWTTRFYGRPDLGVHAIQMELAQRTHLAAEAPPFAFDDAKAGRLRGHLRAALQALEHLAPALSDAQRAAAHRERSDNV